MDDYITNDFMDWFEIGRHPELELFSHKIDKLRSMIAKTDKLTKPHDFIKQTGKYLETINKNFNSDYVGEFELEKVKNRSQQLAAIKKKMEQGASQEIP